MSRIMREPSWNECSDKGECVALKSTASFIVVDTIDLIAIIAMLYGSWCDSRETSYR
jgi:hypothetical protein